MPIKPAQQVGTEPNNVYTAGTSSLSTGPDTCNAQSVEASVAGIGGVRLAVGPTGLTAAPRVISHRGDCHVRPAVNAQFFGPALGTLLSQMGCRLGKVIPSKDARRRELGLPAVGAVLDMQVRGRPVSLAPAGTTVDVRIDSIP